MPKKRDADTRKKVPLFVSYARADRGPALHLLRRFALQTAASKRHRYAFWDDRDILIGANWHKAIQGALKDCKLGLLLISPAFLGSRYITEKELPGFLGRRPKPVLPVMLQVVDPDVHDLKGLQHKQIFRLDRKPPHHPKAFADCVGKTRDEFALELFRLVEARLRRRPLRRRSKR